MKTNLPLCFFLFACLPALCGQDCPVQARADTFICGFAANLYAFPPGGDWAVDCSAAPGPADFFRINDSTTSVTVTECGAYSFRYHIIEVDTTWRLDTLATEPVLIIDTTLLLDTLCLAADTVALSFENPAQAIYDLFMDVTIAYPPSACPAGDTINCRNSIEAGQQPDPVWTFVVGGLCSASRLTAETIGGDSCVAEQILFQSENLTGNILDTIQVPQSAFLQTDSLTGEILVNEYPAMIQQVARQAIAGSGEACPLPENCLNAPPWCYDTLYDTTTVVLPVRTGGQWALHAGTGIPIPLQDTTSFMQDDSLYLVVARPSPRLYAAGFDFFQVNYRGDTVSISALDSIGLQWTEEWGVDTITQVGFNVVDTCCGGGLNLSIDLLGQPRPPVFDCPPAEYVFLPQLSAGVAYPLCQDTFYALAVRLDGGRPPYQFQGLSGTLTDSVFTSDPLPISEGYSILFSDQDNCALRLSGDACPCVGLAAAAADTAFLDCQTHCVSLEGAAANNLGLAPDLEWQDAAGQLLQEGPAVTVCDTGLARFVALEPVSGCRSVQDVVVLDGAPVADAGGPFVLNCLDSTVVLGGAGLSQGAGVTYLWAGPGITDSNRFEPFPVVDMPGQYRLLVRRPGPGCADTADVEVLPDRVPPAADAGPDIHLACNGRGAIHAGNSAAGPDILYRWAGPDSVVTTSDPTLIAEAPGTYYLTVVNQRNGCAGRDTVVAFPSEGIAFTARTEPSCFSMPSGKVIFEDVSGGQPPYSFSADGAVYVPASVVGNLTSGRRRVYVKSQDGCLAEQEVEIGLVEPFSLSLPDEFRICGDTLLVDATVDSQGEDIEYLWGQGLPLGPIQKLTEGGRYTLKIVSRCQTLHRQFTVFDEADLDNFLVFPNAFTPNGDGINDRFLPVEGSAAGIEGYHLAIFNRFGQKVFESRRPEAGWDGAVGGKAAPSEVYFWTARARLAGCDSGAAEVGRSGDVTLLR